MHRPNPRAGSASARAIARQRRIYPAVLETLEARQLLSVDTVTTLADSGAGSLRQTLASAAPGDTVQFASALTGGTITLTSGPLFLTQSVTITGPGVSKLSISGGNAFTVFDVAPGITANISHLTITSGNAGTPFNGGNIYNSGTLNLTGDTITLGAAEIGAGLYNNGGSVTINNSSFSSNTASQQGGAILNAAGGSISITSGTFTGNAAKEEAGGAICNENATLSLASSSLSTNTAGSEGGAIANFSGGMLIVSGSALFSNTASFWGGAIFNFAGANLTINSASTFTSNIADGTFGGAIFNDQGTASIANATFSKNDIIDFSGGVGAAVASFGGYLSISNSAFTNNGDSTFILAAGALYTDDISASIANTSFSGNVAQYGGAIYQDTSGYLAVTGTALEKNTASNYGGAAYLSGRAYFSNSTVAANQAQYGGGIISFGTLTMANSTIATNSASAADSNGGGLYVDQGDTTLYNSIVATNVITGTSTASDITGTLDFFLPAGQAASSYNLIGTGGSGGLINGQSGNKVGASPNLGPLQNNGGPTDTMALLSGSPAIDAGSNALALDANKHALNTDQRGPGYLRIFNSTVDIGAYELQTTPSIASGPAAIPGPSPLLPSGHLPLAPSFGNAGYSVPGFAGLTPALTTPALTIAAAPYVPAQIRNAYGINDIYFNGTPGNGAGQTIAIIDAYNDPNIVPDLNTFSADFGLPQFNVPGGPTILVENENGGFSLPSQPTQGTWDIEESLDVEWAHAIAPQANIILFEASSTSNNDLDTAVTTAKNTPAVAVVSMSYLSYQLIDSVAGVNESATDSLYTTPANHDGVTFLAATGDQGAPGLGYPAASPNVIGVGGTTLLIGADNSYVAEAAWSGGGGGVSLQAQQPAYQVGLVNNTSNSARVSPDVSMDADPNTGVFVYDSYDGGGYLVGGTSLATPMWAALIAIVDQGRAMHSENSLDGVTQTLPMLYNLPASDFHDITTGDNGYPATVGYDLATGLGTPIANLLVPALAGFNATAVWTGLDSNNFFDPNNWNTFTVPNATTNVIINFGSPLASTAINIGTLTITAGELQLGLGSGGSTVAGLSLTGTGSLDLGNNHLYIDFGASADPIASIAADIKSGYSAGAWDGVGIFSSAAALNSAYGIGYADGRDNVVAGLSSGQIEIAYTLYGDANLDYAVNGADFAIVATNFNTAVTRWDQGDFNYDGVVNGADFAALAANFNKGASAAAISKPAVTVTTTPTTTTAAVSTLAGATVTTPAPTATTTIAAVPTPAPATPAAASSTISSTANLDSTGINTTSTKKHPNRHHR